jgi:hypothetical protein
MGRNGVVRRVFDSAIDTLLQAFWGAILAAFLAGGLFVYSRLGGLDPRWTDRLSGAAIACAFLAIAGIALSYLSESRVERSAPDEGDARHAEGVLAVTIPGVKPETVALVPYGEWIRGCTAISVGHHLMGDPIIIDGQSFINCKFEKVLLVYKGRAPFHFYNCEFGSEVEFEIKDARPDFVSALTEALEDYAYIRADTPTGPDDE